ncbi:MAG TPA: MmgE/PrpD family protein [Pseudonocardiaceae bacterium]|nr:MmgE/PrpD family protein [Pseudonocardiaceae bacterium]
MSDSESAVLAAQLELAEWAATLDWSRVPEAVRRRVELVLFDALGVTAVGGRLPERATLVEVWNPAPGPCPLLGTPVRTTPDVAAWLNGSAMVSLELDEGSKFAAGHPAAHGFHAVLALAAQLDADGPTTATALLVAYEVAARFGRATSLRPGTHPHGNWGLAGAAAGCARLLGLSADAMSAAIDTAAGMPIAGPFVAATSGNQVRNEWMGMSNAAGLAAARLAAANMATATGIAAHSLGELLGSFDPTALTDELGTRWEVALGYFKRHSSCAFTHPAADATLALRQRIDLGAVTTIEVDTFAAAAALTGTAWRNRLGAMFSIPFVVASALTFGRVHPTGFGPDQLTDPDLRALAGKVRVRSTAEFDAGLPEHRGARVTVTFGDGHTDSEAVTDPVGDAAFQPLDEAAVTELLTGLLDRNTTARIRAAAAELLTTASARSTLASIDNPID